MAKKRRNKNRRARTAQRSSPPKIWKRALVIVSSTVGALAVAVAIYLFASGSPPHKSGSAGAESASGSGGAEGSDSAPVGTEVTTASGLKYTNLVKGTGARAAPGRFVTVQYVGRLEDGTKFDSSYDAGKPYSFVLGRGTVINGWDEGVANMRVGGKRQLVIPPELGYGAKGFRDKIPPNAKLVFEVELLDVK